MVDPTDRLLAQLSRHGAQLTVMADVAEILRFRRHYHETGRDEFDFQAIENQLRRAVRTGHDVQLHIHPSYYNSRYVEGRLDQDWLEYDLARLPLERLDQIVKEGKDWLEATLQPQDDTYCCFVFRAANWSMNPAHNIVIALMRNGITIDTSVFKYGKRSGMVSFDYTDAHSDLVPWPVQCDNICMKDPEGRLFEFPIYCELRLLLHFLTPNRVYRAVQSRMHALPLEEFAPATEGADDNAQQGRSAHLAKARELLMSRHAWKMDFNQCTGSQLIAAAKRIEKRYGHARDDLPIVLIGHSKTFTAHNERSLEPFLNFVRNHGDRFAFGTFRDFDLARFVGEPV
jgi:hypothetical protein